MERDRDRRRQRTAPLPGSVLDALGATILGTATAKAGRKREAGPPNIAPLRTPSPGRYGDFSLTGRSVTINRSRAEVYAFWRDFSNLSRFMENVVRVEERDGLAEWEIRAPGGRTVRLAIRIVEDRPGERIAWRSVESSDIRTEGRIMLRDASGGRGTVLTAIVAWIPPEGELGRQLASVWRRKPAAQTRHALNRLRMLLETGDIAAARAAE
jgi:uncharacterized membrane protein